MDIDAEISRAIKLLREHENDVVRIIGHDDADGLTSASIVFEALRRENIPCHLTCVKKVDRKLITKLAENKARFYIFTDCGSARAEEIDKLVNEKHGYAIILDHHNPGENKENKLQRVFNINAHLFGFDGANEISGAGISYLFARKLNEKNKELAYLAILGAIGDLQNREGSFSGLNKEILRDAVDSGKIEVKHDLRFFGAYTKPLYKAMVSTTNPFIPGLTANESACIQFLSEIDIPLRKNGDFVFLRDLTKEEKKRLTTAIILKMIEHGIKIEEAEKIVGEVYILREEPEENIIRDANEFVSLLNACGRFERYGLAVSLCLEERGRAYEEAMALLEEHRKSLFSCYEWIYKNKDKIRDEGKFYVFHGYDEIGDTFIGTVISLILSSKILKEEKPIIGFAYADENEVKVSARATKKHVEAGLDLGDIMRKASLEVGGEGGGHNIAAGAQIPRGKEEEFVEAVRKLIRQ